MANVNVGSKDFRGVYEAVFAIGLLRNIINATFHRTRKSLIALADFAPCSSFFGRLALMGIYASLQPAI